MAFKWWLNFRNIVDYALRKSIHWRRPMDTTPYFVKEKLFADLPVEDMSKAIHLANRLGVHYHFTTYQEQTSTGNYQENLFYLNMLDTAAQQAKLILPDPLEVIDIGPSHWFYIHALWSFCTSYQATSSRKVHIRGYEVDPYRVYADFHSRYDHAQAHMAGLDGVEFIPRAFSSGQPPADLITMFFPFVFDRDHLEWGLPLSIFKPIDLLQHARNNLKPGGVLLVVNQGEAEHDRQAAMFTELNIPVLASFHMDPLLFHYDYDRFILVGGKHV